MCSTMGLRLYAFTVILCLSMTHLSGQNACSPAIIREAYNVKSTNDNLFDDHMLAMTNFLNDGSETTWVLESGAHFTENSDGTAVFQGIVKQFGDYAQIRRMSINLTFSGKTYTAPPMSPYNQTGVPTDGWYYYPTISGSFDGLDGLAGGKLDITIHSKAFQVGIGANQIPDSDLDKVAFGAGGWFEWTVISQPTASSLLFNAYIPDQTISDIGLLIGGTPSVPVPPCTASAGSVTLAATALTLSNGSATISATATTNSTIPAGYSVAYVLTTGSDLVIKQINTTPTFTATTVGTCCVHVLVYDPNTLNLSTIQLGVTKATDLNTTLLQGGGCTCASLNLQGDCVTITENPCANINAVFQILNTATNCGTGTPYVVFFNNEYYTAASDLTFTQYTDGNATLNGHVVKSGVSYGIHVDFLGKTSVAPAQSPKLQLCANTSNTNCSAWSYWTTTQGTLETPNGVVTIKRRGPAFQSGRFANLQENKLGASGWFCSNNETLNGDFNFTFGDVIACGNPCDNDRTPPTFTYCPENITKVLTNTGNCVNAVNVTWNTPTATDNCSAVVVKRGNCAASNTSFGIGTKNIIYYATDATGNKSSCNFTVTVLSGVKQCSNVTYGGTIGKTRTNDGIVLNNVTSPTGGSGNMEYVWMKSTTSRCPTSRSYVIPNSNAADYKVGKVTQTTYFVRCARRTGCTANNTWIEAKYICVYPTDCGVTNSTDFNPNKCYKIVNRRSGKCLDVYNSWTCNDAPAIQWGGHSGANQQWQIAPLGNNCFKMKARHSGKYLACSSSYNNTNTAQNNYCSGGMKDWKIEPANYGCYKITHRASGRVLNVSENSTRDGAKVQICNWTGNDSQLWQIVETPATGNVLSAVNNTVFTTNAAAEVDRARIEFINNQGFRADYFTVEKQNQTTGDFEILQIVNNSSDNDDLQHHTSYDRAPTEGDNIYRVKVTYTGGETDISPILTVNYKGLLQARVFPNPATDVTSIDLSQYVDRNVSISLYNNFGQIVKTVNIGKAAKQTYDIDLSDIGAGNYTIHVDVEGKRTLMKRLAVSK